jgi:hypothetical protein
MTCQHIADMALASDRQARAARARGDTATAESHDRETQRLLAMI